MAAGRRATIVAWALLVSRSEEFALPAGRVLSHHVISHHSSTAHRSLSNLADGRKMLPYLHTTTVQRRGRTAEMNGNVFVRASPILLLLFCFNYASANPLLVPILVVRDIVCLGLDFLGGSLKFGWRFAVFLFVASMAARMVLQVVMAGGPLKALKAAFFGTAGRVCDGLEGIFSERISAPGLAEFFGKVARGCEERTPVVNNPFGGANPFGGGGANPFGGGGANPFGGGGANPFGGGGANPFGGGGANPFGGGGANPFGGGGANPFGGGGANPFEDLLSAAAAGEGVPAAPSSPFSATSATPGVTVNVRRPGGADGSSSQPSSGAKGSRAGGGAGSWDPTPPRRSSAGSNSPPGASGKVIDVEGTEDVKPAAD
jgi:hypothetical protein